MNQIEHSAAKNDISFYFAKVQENIELFLHARNNITAILNEYVSKFFCPLILVWVPTCNSYFWLDGTA